MNNYSIFNGELPYNYQTLNKFNTAKIPSSVHLKDNEAFDFFARYLLQRIFSVYEFKIPDTWDMSLMLYSTFCNGATAIFNTEEYGVIPMNATLGGLNLFYQPRYAYISNPLLDRVHELEIGKDCALLRLMPNYGNVMDIVAHYAAQLALLYESTNANIMNSRLAYIVLNDEGNPKKGEQGGKAGAKKIQTMMDSIYGGEPMVVIGGKGMINEMTGKPNWIPLENNIGGNFIAPQLQALAKKVEAEFDNEIGIPNTNTDKAERMLVDEVNSNNVSTYSKAALWLDYLKEGVKQAIELYPELEGEFSIDWRIDPMETSLKDNMIKNDAPQTAEEETQNG